ncbi:exopolysaccharide biosynthesis protein [Thermoclostridium stercorarium subsp. thermolacticum DSM 2910]|uniref:Exopolysaccharide biosynthesis protein n=1 Tax=Thermoclostridium stercorarium subsp. thermolacticum DSM 2910 TaxID=1121336 RepID=A0A1B1YFA0_THEST|nr:phosphodiester glycosidase family protein [Thermoclostridium stercorarium]ANW99439.1 exopolysaccharide biosynthesis protein [Thermoclostridium stercorarium subsp. thermolacticum DSM 2910]
MRMKKAAVFFLSLLLFFAGIIPVSFASNATSNSVIYQKVETKIITSGVTQETITRFTDLGWQTIYVLKADLNDPYVYIDALANGETIQKPLSTTDHMKEWGAIAGINGSFFLSSDQTGMQNPIGPLVQSWNLLTADATFNRDKDNMATFAIDETRSGIIDYWKADIRIYAPNGEYISVSRYNEPYYGYTDFTVQDRKWTTTSTGNRNGYYTDVLEMIVEDGVVKEIRVNMPGTEIPVNGYVVITSGENKNRILNNFNVGDPVRFEVTTSPDWTKIQMAVSGGGMLVVNGTIPDKFTHEVAGRHPRTAVGTSRDGKTIYMVVVDGRQSHSIGMTMTELAQFMLGIGAYNALALDGGGSSTIASREPGTNTVVVQNKPSDGVQRRIPNAIGVFSIAPPAPLAGLYVEAEEPNVFVNTSRKFTVKGYDQYFNPVQINPDEVTWRVEGVEGSFTGNVFRPLSSGTAKIIATVGDVSAETYVKVLDQPAKLTLSSSSITLIAKEQKKLTVTGEDGEGFTASINPADVSWKTVGNIGFVSGGTFVATNSGYGYISASVGNAYAYCAVTVLPTVSTLVDDFEKDNATFLSYPSTVTGSYQISGEQKHGGNFSGKLTYRFETADTNRAVYAVFNGEGYTLPENAIRVGFWVYNDHENSNWLRIEVQDSQNKTQRLGDITKMDWIGWRYVEIPLNGISLPAKLTRIYLVQVNPVEEAGEIFIDDLSIITVERNKMPASTEIPGVETVVATGFETDAVDFTSFPSWVPASAAIVSDYKNTGTSSVRLDYVFKAAPETQAAYIVLPGNGISVPDGAETIGLWAYSQKTTKSWLRAEVVDADGKVNYVMLSEGINWTGWAYVEGKVSHIKRPARVTRLYVVNPSPIDEKGSIYLDDLQFRIKTNKTGNFNNIPQNTVQADSKNQAVKYVAGEKNYRFSVFGEAREPANDVEKYLTNYLADKINKYIEIGAFVGNGSHQVTSKVKKPVIATGKGYKSMDVQGSRFIQLDIESNSLRNGTTGQWKWLLNQLESFNGQNVFIFMESSPDTFSDRLEAQLFKDILAEYAGKKFRNVWVFYKGDSNTVTKDRGVRYFSTCGLDVQNLTANNKKVAQYILVTIMGDQVTYEYKPIE